MGSFSSFIHNSFIVCIVFVFSVISLANANYSLGVSRSNDAISAMPSQSELFDSQEYVEKRKREIAEEIAERCRLRKEALERVAKEERAKLLREAEEKEQRQLEKQREEEAKAEASRRYIEADHRRKFWRAVRWIVGVLGGLFIGYKFFRNTYQNWDLLQWSTAGAVVLLLISVIGGADDFLWEIYDLPYGYYTFMRLIVTALCCYHAVRAIVTEAHPLLIILPAALAVLFQPIIKIEMEHNVWCHFNIVAIIVLICYVRREMRSEQEKDKKNPTDEGGAGLRS